MSLFNLLPGLFLIISWSSCVSTNKKVNTKFVLILIDGFRHDYVKTIPNLIGFKYIIANGVTTDYVTPIFPSTSFPNYYTILTGLFAESHGFIGNFMYDESTNKSFLIGTNPDSNNPFWWEGAEPLWITAEKQGVKTAIYYWFGCHIKIHETNPHYCKPYDNKAPNNKEIEAAMDDTISKFKTNEVQMSFIYYELIDKIGHYYGPFSAELNRTVESFDQLLIKFRQKLKDNKLEDDVNIILVSDHGMIPISEEKEVKLYEYADINNYSVAFPECSIVLIYPKKDQKDRLYKSLEKIEHAKVYRKEDFPLEWHFKKNKLTPELLVVAEEGYSLLLNKEGWNHYTFKDERTGNKYKWGGMHGYDNKLPSMRSFFAAIGPDFKQGYLNEPILEVDMYNIMCNIMNIEPQPNNGTWNTVKNMLIVKNDMKPSQPNSLALSKRCNTVWILFLSTIMTVTQLISLLL